MLVAGDGADDIGKQSGGWTLTWQGTGLTKLPISRSAVDLGRASPTQVAGRRRQAPTLSVDGKYKQKPDVAIVVFGEDPYAEFQGDMQTCRLPARATTTDLDLMQAPASRRAFRWSRCSCPGVRCG